MLCLDVMRQEEGKTDTAKRLMYLHLCTELSKIIVPMLMELTFSKMSDSEKLRYDIYMLVRSRAEWELPLFLTQLNIESEEGPSAVFPSSMVSAETVEEINKALKCLIYCYNTLSPSNYAAQLRYLVSSVRTQASKGLLTFMLVNEIPMPDELCTKLGMIANGTDFETKFDKHQLSLELETASDWVEVAYDLASSKTVAEVGEAKNAIVDKLSSYENVNWQLTDHVSACLADHVLGEACRVIENASLSAPAVTRMKIAIYYSIRFAQAIGEPEFWDTPIYKDLMEDATNEYVD